MKNYLSILFGFIIINVQSQMSGNQVYGKNDYNTNRTKNSTITINDNHLTLNVKVLLNNKADSFSIVLGTNEEAETVSVCNTQINQRINGFIKELLKNNIKKEAIYVDFISQTKVYDYNIENNTAEQFQKGFEIKKNIIISSKNVYEIENIITLASKYEIYDVIKVDYSNNDVLSIHGELFKEALKIAEQKKETYVKAFKKRIIGTPNATEDFSVIFPNTQYKKYEAFENSEIETYSRNSNQNFIKKLARKNTTYYYDSPSTSDFDKVINIAQSEVGIQYVLIISITYKIDTSL
ncbi:SIMPL domain-containing protein [Flavobacterium sp.]|uniref:SIMPL domain-containing protein n=1 Tax=Flavobacterium sp. TaxID=239 RepID=UPI004048956B